MGRPPEWIEGQDGALPHVVRGFLNVLYTRPEGLDATGQGSTAISVGETREVPAVTTR
jgi:hypothetical protein